MDSDIEDRLTINKAFAAKYEKKKRVEELSKLRDLHGDESSSESSNESEDEEGVWSAEKEAEFLRTLSLLKNKDPRIYDQTTTFYSTTDEAQPTNSQRSKVMYLRDYEREQLLKGSQSDDSDEEEGKPPTYAEEQEALKEGFRTADSDSDEPLLTVRNKTSKEKAAEEADYCEWLRDNEGNKDLDCLRAYWGNPLLDKGEQFLRDYILGHGHRDNAELSMPSYEEVVDSGASDTEDEEALEEQEEFERKYNFRYEEPESDLIKSYPRTISSSVRTLDTGRRDARLQRQERKKQEREQEREELRRLKNLKQTEVESRLTQLATITGSTVHGLGSLAEQVNLDLDFDPKSYDQSMGTVFGEDYYQGGEEEEKPDLGLEDDEDLWDKELYCEDPDFNMDADFDSSAKQTTTKRSRGKKSRVTFDLGAESANEPTVKEGTFKYRSVLPNNYGLSTDEVLLCDNRELNSWVSLSKMVQYRTEEEEKKDKRIFRKRGRDWQRKRRHLATVYTAEEKDDEEEETKEKPKDKETTKTKKRKSKVKGQKGGSKSRHKLSDSRLESYGM